MKTIAIIETAEQCVVASALRATNATGPAIDLLRQVIADAAARNLAIHRFSTNGNRKNGGNWIRTYTAHPADLPRPRLSGHCDGPAISINREGSGANSKFFLKLQQLHSAILAEPTVKRGNARSVPKNE
jgi:hypothetical protein